MSAKEVKVYSTPTCPWCRRVQQFHEDNSIKYKDFNVTEDPAARDRDAQ